MKSKTLPLEIPAKTDKEMAEEILHAVWSSLDSVFEFCDLLKSAYQDELEMIMEIGSDPSIDCETRSRLEQIAKRTLERFDNCPLQKRPLN